MLLTMRFFNPPNAQEDSFFACTFSYASITSSLFWEVKYVALRIFSPCESKAFVWLE